MNAPPWVERDRVWAYCLLMIGITMWGVDRQRRRVEEFWARHMR